MHITGSSPPSYRLLLSHPPFFKLDIQIAHKGCSADLVFPLLSPRQPRHRFNIPHSTSLALPSDSEKAICNSPRPAFYIPRCRERLSSDGLDDAGTLDVRDNMREEQLRGALIQFPARTYRDADVPDGSMTGLQILHSNQSPLEVDSREERPIGSGLLCTDTTGCYWQRATPRSKRRSELLF